MHISDRLIERVLAGGGTKEEEREVMEFFLRHPDRLDLYMTEEQWEQFELDKQGEAPRDEILMKIEERVGRAPVRKMRYWWVAAASLVLVAGLGVSIYRGSGSKRGNTIEVVTMSSVVPAKDSTKLIANATLKPQVHFLPDGSKVRLGSHSKVSFASAFAGRREIYLEGEAMFTVVKDDQKPFVVHTKKIATTVLGTVFSVSDRDDHFTSVRLYSGKVVVGGGSMKAVYLQPGQQLLVNNRDFTAQVKSEEPRAESVAVVLRPARLEFNKRPLVEIFNSLEKAYGVSISYDAAGLKNMDFTGVFNKDKESVESFLTTLCDLNDLSIRKSGDRQFVIAAK